MWLAGTAAVEKGSSTSPAYLHQEAEQSCKVKLVSPHGQEVAAK